MAKLTKRQAELAAIRKANKVLDTTPEKAMKSILDEMGIEYSHDQNAKVTDPSDNSTYLFQLDFVLPFRQDVTFEPYCSVLEINGHHHQTPRFKRKDAWKADLLLHTHTSAGLIISKVIEYDAEFLRLKKFRPLAIEALRKALASTDRIVWCDA